MYDIVCVYIYIYVYIHTYIHTYTHVYICAHVYQLQIICALVDNCTFPPGYYLIHIGLLAQERGLAGSSGMRCFRMWCLMIIVLRPHIM